MQSLPALAQSPHPDGYYRLADIERFADELSGRYPGLVDIVEIGRSVKGGPIRAVKISDRVDRDESGEAEVLITAGVHPREQQPIHFALNLLRDLAHGYDTDPRTRKLVQSRQIWVIPCLNPDGKVHDFGTTGGDQRGWRKNLRDNGDGSLGVDLNRNSPLRWSVAEELPPSPLYQGKTPFSEPETKALRDFIDSRRFRAWLDIHSSGGELLTPRHLVRDDRERYGSLHTTFLATQAEPYTKPGNTHTFEAATTPLPVHREGNTGLLWGWGYYTRGVYSALLEVRRDERLPIQLQHYPPAEFIEREYEVNGRGAMLAFIEHAGDLPPVRKPSRALDAWLGLESFTLDDDFTGDSYGNSDGRANPGETLELRHTLHNSGRRTAERLWATLTSHDPSVIVTLEYQNGYGDIAPGQTSVEAVFVVKVPPDAPPGKTVEMELNVFDAARYRWRVPVKIGLGR